MESICFYKIPFHQVILKVAHQCFCTSVQGWRHCMERGTKHTMSICFCISRTVWEILVHHGGHHASGLRNIMGIWENFFMGHRMLTYKSHMQSVFTRRYPNSSLCFLKDQLQRAFTSILWKGVHCPVVEKKLLIKYIKEFLGPIRTAQKFKKLWKHGTMYQCIEYQSTTKRNSYTVDFSRNGH